MEDFGILIPIALVAVLAFGFSIVSRQNRTKLWREATDRLGLDAQIPGTGSGVICEAHTPEGTFQAQYIEGGERKQPRLVVTLSSTFARGVLVDRERIQIGPLGRSIFETGEERFDDAFFVDGERASALAALSDDVRSRLLEIRARGRRTTLQDSVLRWDTRVPRRSEDVRDVIRLTLGAGKRLKERETMGRPAALLDNVATDRTPKMRVMSLEAIGDEFPERLDEAVELAEKSGIEEVASRARGLRRERAGLTNEGGLSVVEPKDRDGALSPASRLGALSEAEDDDND